MIGIKPSVRGENRCFSGGRIISLGSAEAGLTSAEYSVVNTVINREVVVSPHIGVFFDSLHSYFSNLSSHTGVESATFVYKEIFTITAGIIRVRSMIDSCSSHCYYATFSSTHQNTHILFVYVISFS